MYSLISFAVICFCTIWQT